MSIVLNGSTGGARRGYGYGYGYGYGDEYKEVSYRKRIKHFFRSLAHKVKR